MAAHQLMFCLTIFLSVLSWPVESADPDPLQDFCIAELKDPIPENGFPCKPASKVTSEDFFFDGLSKEGNTSNAYGSSVSRGNVLAFPGLNTQGMSMNRVDLAPGGGINPPHWHPRSTETGIVIEGKILVGLVTTGNTYYYKVLNPGEMFVVPRGLMHFQMNVGKGRGLIFTSFNSHLPGSVPVGTNLFSASPSIPDVVLAKTFHIDHSIVDGIKSKFGV